MKKYLLVPFFLVNVAHANFITDWWGGLFKGETVIEEGTTIKQINDQSIVEGDVTNEVENLIENQTTIQGDQVTNEVEAKIDIGETKVSNEVNVPDQITVAPDPLRIEVQNPLEIPQPLSVMVSEFKQELKVVSDIDNPLLETLQKLASDLAGILKKLETHDAGESARIDAAILSGISSENPHFVTETRNVILEGLEFATFQTVIERATVFFEDEDSGTLKKKSLT